MNKWEDPIFHEGRMWGRMEMREQIISSFREDVCEQCMDSDIEPVQLSCHEAKSVIKRIEAGT